MRVFIWEGLETSGYGGVAIAVAQTVEDARLQVMNASELNSHDVRVIFGPPFSAEQAEGYCAIFWRE